MHTSNRRLLAIILIAICGAAACKKSTTAAPALRYHITRVVDSATYINVYGYSDPNFLQVNAYDITYNKNIVMQMNFSTLFSTGPYSQSDVANFIYYDSSYAIYHTNYPYPDSVVANGLDEILFVNGLHSAEFIYDPFFRVTFFYESNQLTGGQTQYSCTWDKDNNISSAITAVNDTAVFTYYLDKSNAAADIFEINNFLTYGTQIIHTKNLTKSIISTYSQINAAYTFDTNNRIINTRSVQTDQFTYSGNDTITHSFTFTYSAY